jgi:AraC-like DNA-binding protein
MLLALPPCAALTRFVRLYCLVEDIAGERAGVVIETCPYPGAVLTVNLGQPNSVADGPITPEVSFLGVQTKGRKWLSCPETYFVMIFLTFDGLARLFPHDGALTANDLADLGSLIGDSATARLLADISAAPDPAAIAEQLDGWLVKRLEGSRPIPEMSGLAEACARLRGGQEIQGIARSLNVNRRQIGRWFQRYIGLSPKSVMMIERLNGSVRNIQLGNGGPVDGYCDQAHQIRSWRKMMGVTPAAYANRTLSPMAAYLGRLRTEAPAFYL